MLNLVLTMLDRIERVMTFLVAVCLFVIMAIVTADVVLRYIFDSPTSWVFDLVSLYLMPAVFLLAASSTFAAHDHVRVDILLYRVSDQVRRVLEIIGNAISGVVFTLVALAGFCRTIGSFQADEVLAGAIPWPTWVSTALIPLGFGLLALRLFVHVIGHFVSLLLHTAALDLPPLADAAHVERETFE